MSPSLARPLVWLAVLTVAGRRYRFSTGPVLEVTSTRDGYASPYHGLLSVDVERSVSLDPASPPQRSGSLTLAHPTLTASEVAWDGATVDLYLWHSGTLEDARHVLHADVSEVAWADPEAVEVAVSFSESIPVTGDLLDAAAVCSDDTFPAAGPGGLGTDGQPATASVGQAYPWVIGQPGADWPDTYETRGPGSRALFANSFLGALAKSYTILIAHGGAVDSTTLASGQVLVFSQENEVESLPLIELTDAQGRTITAVDTSSSAALTLSYDPGSVTGDWYLSWPSPAGLHAGKALRGAGDVILWALDRAQRHGRAEVDWPRTRAGVAALNRFKVDTYIDQQIDAWDWLTGQLLPFLPVVLGRSGRGIWLQEWDLSAPAVLHLRAGVNAHRYSARSEIRDETAHAGLIVRGQPSAKNGWYAREIEYHADRTRAGFHPFLARAAALGAKTVREVDCPVISDAASLQAVAAWQLARYARPRVEIWYRAHWRLGWIEEGATVLITDAGAGLDARKALVQQVRTESGSVLLGLTLLGR